MSYIKNLTINQNYKFLTIPKDIVGKLYLEYKTINDNSQPIDDQLVLQNIINGETARYLFYDCFSNWNARTIYYNGTESQVTSKGDAHGDTQGMAIDFSTGIVTFYYNGNLFGSVKVPDPNNFRDVIITLYAGHTLAVEQRLYPYECLYTPSGYKTFMEFLPIPVVKHNNLLYWYK